MSLPLANKRGMTLFEACLVTALLGVLSTLAIPRIRLAQESFKLTAAAYEVRSELHRTRI